MFYWIPIVEKQQSHPLELLHQYTSDGLNQKRIFRRQLIASEIIKDAPKMTKFTKGNNTTV